MLLRFGVSNRLSMRDRQELSLTASSLKDPTGGLIDCPSAPSGSVLPAALIYGANASGKSNLVDSIRVMREMVLSSHRKGEPGGGVPTRRPFALDPANSLNPTCFDVDFVMDGMRHHYGFEASDEAFLSEWLYAFPKGHRRTLFEREGGKFHFGRALGGQNKNIAALAHLYPPPHEPLFYRSVTTFEKRVWHYRRVLRELGVCAAENSCGTALHKRHYFGSKCGTRKQELRTLD